MDSTTLGCRTRRQTRSWPWFSDLAFLHDSSALVASAHDTSTCTLVVLDNAGADIFSFLAQSDALDHDRSALVRYPATTDVTEVATGFHLPVDIRH